MAILIHVEVSARELNSKLLLAVLSAHRGYDVLVGDVIMAARLNIFPKSIFHTKNVSPSRKVLGRHQKLVDNGHIVTSLDEEGPGVEYELTQGYLNRFSEKSIGQTQAVFCWGTDEHQALLRKFPNHSSKIFMTGSPRADFWEPRFSRVSKQPADLPDEPFVLISSNMGLKRSRPVPFLLDPGGGMMYPRSVVLDKLEIVGQDFKMLAAFVRAIEYLAERLDRGCIVVRPHPSESVVAWENLLEGVPRVAVIREGSISAWLESAVAVVHNGCTTGIEATISGRRLISYTPIEQNFLLFPNDLGSRAYDQDELVQKVRLAFKEHDSGQFPSISERDREIIGRKVLHTEGELASTRIINIWEGLGAKHSTTRFGRITLRFLLLSKQIWHVFARAAIGLRIQKQVLETNQKFPPIDRQHVIEAVKNLTEILSLDDSIELDFLGNRTILLRAKRSHGDSADSDKQ